MVTIAHLRRRRRRLEWALLACALMALVAWLSTADSLGRVNHLVQDAGFGFSIPAFVRNGWLSVIGSLLLTGLIWGAIAARGGWL